MSNITEEIKKRRTFAIISHPDAGKTTLTEKFLLYGGAINLAGTVKGRKAAKHAVSDWMEIEKERGISVTSSAMQFNYDGFCINILDTPGHQDFSEDTYRTLMAADSAVMVIDGSKGVEAQTIKLFKVCVMRHIPIFTFINKFDREARDPYELLDEIEEVLGIRTCPVNWPIGCGKNFKGVYDRFTKKISSFTAAMGGAREVATRKFEAESPEAESVIGPIYYQQLMDDIELLDGASDELDMDRVQRGDLSPVFFGSALTNFGVETFLEHFLKMTTSPLPRKSLTVRISFLPEKGRMRMNCNLSTEDLKMLEEMEFNLSDFALFLSVMKNKSAHQNVLSIITGNSELHLKYVHVEEVILNRSGKRAIRLDAQAVDDKNCYYATEMQNDTSGDDIRRR